MLKLQPLITLWVELGRYRELEYSFAFYIKRTYRGKEYT